MSYESRKGYDGEYEVLTYLASHFRDVELYRPRAGAPQDRGDILGLPLVISVKNHVALDLGRWIKDLDVLVRNAHVETGLVWHKRVRVGSAAGWYVTMTGAHALPLLESYVESQRERRRT